jgi:hypothetical protein
MVVHTWIPFSIDVLKKTLPTSPTSPNHTLDAPVIMVNPLERLRSIFKLYRGTQQPDVVDCSF